MTSPKSELMRDLGAAIRRQRKVLRLTQQQLGELAGCGVAFLYLLETGKPTVRMDKVLDVLMVLGLQLRLEPGKAGIAIDGALS